MRRTLYIKACRLLGLIVLVAHNADGQAQAVQNSYITPPAAVPPWHRLRPTFYDRKLTDAQKALLAPSPEDQAAFAAFLRQENTGLFRLLPKGRYEFGHTVSAESDANLILPILGGGASYSFAEKTHKFGPWSDIRLENNRLVAGVNGLAVGILTGLGDVPLESVSLETPGLEFLTRLVPPTQYAEVADLVRRSARGVTASGFTYGAVVEALPNTTYALRSILYKKDGYLVNPDDPYTRLRLHKIGYAGSDLLVAFRVVRRYTDGSLAILWKRLQKYQAAKVKGELHRHTFKSIKQLFERELAKGMPAAQVSALLDSAGIDHSDYVDGYDDANAPEGTRGLVQATIPAIERRPRATFDLYLQFYFDEKRGLIDYTMKQARR